ncbi:MAG: hypothetical protein RL266_1804 [Bacteroidota bacterium]|jgi:hypothetical protein
MKLRYLCAMQELALDTVQLMNNDSIGSMALALDSAVVVVEETPVVSLFSGHELQATDLTWLEHAETGNTFGFFVIAICALVLLYLRKNSDGIFSSVLRSSFDRNLAMQEARVENSQRSRNLFLLLLVGGTSITLFLSIVSHRAFQLSESLSPFFFRVLGVLLIMLTVKRSVLFGLSLIFGLNQELKVHSFNQNLMHSVAGLFLLPISLMLFYNESIPFHWLATIGIAISVLFYIQGLLRGMQLALYTARISILHLFYYFCALEILPVFVLIRLTQSM